MRPDHTELENNHQLQDVKLEQAAEVTTPDASPQPHPGHAHHQLKLSPLHELAFCAILCSTQLITQSQLGTVLVPLQIIGNSFENDTVGQRSWFCAAYSLTVGSFVLIAGQLGDIYGHKRMLVAGWLWTGLWSLIAGLSVYTRSTVFFDICRALQGIGPAFLLPNGLAILSHAYPPGRRKEMIFAIFAAMAPIGFTVGALVSSAFAMWVHWSWSFYTAAIWCAIMTCLVLLLVPDTHFRAQSSSIGGPLVFDGIGAFLGVVGLVSINFAWNQAVVVGWSAPYTYALLIFGILILMVFAHHEARTANPLVPMDIWNGKVTCIIICLGLGWGSFGTWIFYTYQLILVERGNSAIIGAVQFFPETISGVMAAIATGYLLSRVPATWLMCGASLSFLVSCLLSATAPVHQTYWANIFVSMIFMAWGNDVSFPASTLILSDIVPPERQGITASMVNTVINYSISIGLGISGTVNYELNREGDQELRALYAALWTSVGLSGLAVVISFGYSAWAQWKELRNRKPLNRFDNAQVHVGTCA